MSVREVESDRSFAARWIYFAWWPRLAARASHLSARWRWMILGVAAIVGVGARFLAQTAPSNYDFESYLVVSDSVLGGENPYETGRYNYGPPWFLILAAIRGLLGEPDAFRLGLTLVLSLADIAIALVLVRRGWLPAAVVVLLAPTSIAISGQHHQFDNVAIALGLCAAAFVPSRLVGRIGSNDILAVCLLGLSLSVKHLFIALSLWWAVKQKTLLRGVFYAVTPLVIFMATLTPFLILSFADVRRYVIGYRSAPSAPLYNWLLPDEVVWGAVNRGWISLLFLLLLIAAGLMYRRVPTFETTLAYLVTLVLLSSAMVDQYLAIPTAAVAVFLNIAFVLWLSLAGVYVFGDPDDLNWPVFAEIKLRVIPRHGDNAFPDMVPWLFAGWGIMTWWLLARESTSIESPSTEETSCDSAKQESFRGC